MPLHSSRSSHPRRHRDSLGHLKLNLDDLEQLVDRWAPLCRSVTLSVGDGITADFVEDLQEVTTEEISNLVIRTEQPAISISLRRSRAEISYSDDPADRAAVNAIKSSLEGYKIRTPSYRLRIFWVWIYSFVVMVSLFTDFKYQSMRKPPPFLVGTPFGQPPPPPPQPPPFIPSLIVITLGSFIFLTVWVIRSYRKLNLQSSTRIIRKKRY